MAKWIKTPLGNEILIRKDEDTGKEYYISYQDFISMRKHAHKGIEELKRDPVLREKLLKDLDEIHTWVKLEPETAIVSDEVGHLILKGDHRKEYEALETYDKCIKYFEDKAIQWKT